MRDHLTVERTIARLAEAAQNVGADQIEVARLDVEQIDGRVLLNQTTPGTLRPAAGRRRCSGPGGSWCVNPRQVRDVAKATGQLAKTDRLDARVLTHFGAALAPRETVAQAVDVDASRALLASPSAALGPALGFTHLPHVYWPVLVLTLPRVCGTHAGS